MENKTDNMVNGTQTDVTDNLSTESIESADAPMPERTLKREKVEINEDLFENSTVLCAAEPKKEKKHKLSPIKKGIISISALAVVTAAAVVTAVLFIPKGDDTDAPVSSADDIEISVMSVDQKDIEQVKVKNAKDSYTLLPQIVTDSTSSTESTSVNWLAKGYEDVELSTAAYIVDAVTSVKAIKTFDRNGVTVGSNIASDSSETVSSDSGSSSDDPYGFDKPHAAAAVTLKDGGSYTVTIGAVSPDKSGRYAVIDGEGSYASYGDKIYLMNVSDVNCMANSLADCVNMLSMPAFVSEGDDDTYFEEGEMLYFDDMTISGTLYKEKIKVICPQNDLALLTYMIEEPSEQAANEESVSSILALASSGVYNSGAYVLHASSADRKKYGIDNPYVSYYIKAGNREMTMKIGKKCDDGNYPFMISYSTDGGKTVVNHNIIYRLNAETNKFVELKSTDIYYEKLFIEYVKYVESMTVSVGGGKTVKFTLDHDKDNASQFAVTTDAGKKIDQDEFCYYYTRLLYLSALENEETATPSDNNYIIKFNITYTTEGKKADEIIIYPYANNVRRCIYKLNGKGTALVNKTLVDDLVDCLEPLANGKAIGNKYD